MKILVLSDTHGYLWSSVTDVLKKIENLDVMIHCGDNYEDAAKLSEILNIKQYYHVPGNCDYHIKNVSDLLEIELEGKKILITHGHMQGVKSKLSELKHLVKEYGADIVLFGHTHLSYREIDDGILYLNPGSPVMPKDGKYSYGIIDLSSDKIDSRIVNF